MRWPLRHQILVPLIGLLLSTLAAVSGINAYLSVRDAKTQIQGQLDSVARTLANSSFPLTDAVLRQAAGLSGAEFLVASGNGKTLSTSRTDLSPVPPASKFPDEISLDQSVFLGREEFFHAARRILRRPGSPEPLVLHVFYPVESYRVAWHHAVLPPLLVGGLALVIAVPMGIAIAAHVGRPIGRLRRHVNQIAEGDFRSIPLPRRDDEILDLGRSVNRMAEMLAGYEEEVRRSERLKTLGQLGGGIAHQLRNSATGCRMALDLHIRESPAAKQSENLSVAIRQLTLMERYVKRFLSMQNPKGKPHVRTDLVPLVDNVIPLVRPAAAHAGVALEWSPPAIPCPVTGDADALEQLLMNLLLNAVDAASRGVAAANRAVALRVASNGDDSVEVEIEDSGAGPPSEIGDRLFEPLVTGKTDGTGLGLSVAREICAQHGGTIRWDRRDGKTLFIVALPLAEQCCVEASSR